MEGTLGAFEDAIGAALAAKQRMLADVKLLERCAQTAQLICDTYRAGGKVLFCGNGGSAAEAQHMSAELSGRYAFDRPPLDAEALHVNTSFLTAVANDYGFDHVFSRMLAACGRPGDVLVAYSTSGQSRNVLLAVEEAKRIGVTSVAFTGEDLGAVGAASDIAINVPSTQTPRIQECHTLLSHTICGLVESELFGSSRDSPVRVPTERRSGVRSVSSDTTT